jgi:hypothetical protein
VWARARAGGFVRRRRHARKELSAPRVCFPHTTRALYAPTLHHGRVCTVEHARTRARHIHHISTYAFSCHSSGHTAAKTEWEASPGTFFRAGGEGEGEEEGGGRRNRGRWRQLESQLHKMQK